MADQNALPAVTPGVETSEFKLTKVAMICAFVVAICGGVTEALTQVGTLAPGLKWVGAALGIVALVSGVASQIAYTITRGTVKAAALDAGAQVASAASATPAAAGAELAK